jgi:hypothetical protein
VGDVVYLARSEGVGCDRLSLSFPLAAFDPSAFDRASLERDAISETVEVGSWLGHIRPGPGTKYSGAAVTIGARKVAGAWWGKVEANPSRFVDPAGCGLLPLHLADRAVEAMADVVWSRGMVPALDTEDWRVKRLDLARDFTDVAAPEFFIRGLEPLPRKYARRKGVWSDVDCGSAQTLHVGSGAGMARLYDQFAAYADKGAVRGDVRAEFEFRDGWLGGAGVVTVSDLDQRRCEDLVGQRWPWSRFGEVVTGKSNVLHAVDRLVRAGGYVDDAGEFRPVTRARARSFLGYLWEQSAGASWGASNDAHYEYERIARHLGVRPCADLLGASDVDYAARLDFEVGREVAA